MEIKDYHKIIINKYKKGEYAVKGKKDIDKPSIEEKKFPQYAINYLIWEFLKQNDDDRWKKILDFVVVPNEIETFDFTGYEFEDFFKFMMSIKT